MLKIEQHTNYVGERAYVGEKLCVINFKLRQEFQKEVIR